MARADHGNDARDGAVRNGESSSSAGVTAAPMGPGPGFWPRLQVIARGAEYAPGTDGPNSEFFVRGADSGSTGTDDGSTHSLW